MDDVARWWQHGVIYQVYPRSFQDTDGDGIGDLDGVTARLDHLVTLGVDALWLSPFYRSPMRDFGYDIADHTDVDPRFGDLDAFDRMLAAAHERGLRVLIDFVPNHTSDQHPWFLESRSSRSSARRDWYVWRDPRPDGSPPNNWISVWGGPAWQWDEGTGQYYLHLFLPEMPDLNWRNPQVRRAMFDVVRFWMDRGVDGLRIDVAHVIMKHPELLDNPRNDARVRSYKTFGNWDDFVHINDLGHPDVHDVYRELRTILDGYSTDERPRVAVGEIHIFERDQWVTYYGRDLDELHLPFNFGLLTVDWTAGTVRRSVDELEAAVPDGAWPNYVVGNHDEPRIATRVGPRRARLVMLLLLTLRGTPTLYYGDELGMSDVEVPDDQVADPQGLRLSPELSRDPARAPLRWDGSPHGGFTAPHARPWLPIDVTVDDVATQLDDPGSMLTLTRRLLALRRCTPALSHGAYAACEAPSGCFVFVRSHGDDRVVVALNFSDAAVEVVLDGPAEVLLSTTPARDGIVTSLLLEPFEGCVVRPRRTPIR